MKGKKKVIKIGDKSKVIDVIKKIKLNPETVIVKRGQEILLETDDLKPNDKIEFIKIVSGG
jgi:sulfur carrier protein ThiS